MPAQHLPGNLRISWLVGAYQSEPISPEDWHQPVKQKEGSKNEEADGLQGFIQGRETSFRSSKVLGRFTTRGVPSIAFFSTIDCAR